MNFFSFKSKMRVQNFNGCIKLSNMSYGGFFARVAQRICPPMVENGSAVVMNTQICATLLVGRSLSRDPCARGAGRRDGLES